MAAYMDLLYDVSNAGDGPISTTDKTTPILDPTWKDNVSKELAENPAYFRNIDLKEVSLHVQIPRDPKDKTKLHVHYKGERLRKVMGPPMKIQRACLNGKGMFADHPVLASCNFLNNTIFWATLAQDSIFDRGLPESFPELEKEQRVFSHFLVSLKDKITEAMFSIEDIGKTTKDAILYHLRRSEIGKLEGSERKLAIAKFRHYSETPHKSESGNVGNELFLWKRISKKGKGRSGDGNPFSSLLLAHERTYEAPLILGPHNQRLVSPSEFRETAIVKANQYYIPVFEPKPFNGWKPGLHGVSTDGYGVSFKYVYLKALDAPRPLETPTLEKKKRKIRQLKQEIEAHKQKQDALTKDIAWKDEIIEKKIRKLKSCAEKIEDIKEKMETLGELVTGLEEENVKIMKYNSVMCEDVARLEEMQGKLDLMCRMCKEHAMTTILYPCKHLGLCKACADQLVQNKDKCPFCRRKIVWSDSVFLQ